MQLALAHHPEGGAGDAVDRDVDLHLPRRARTSEHDALEVHAALLPEQRPQLDGLLRNGFEPLGPNFARRLLQPRLCRFEVRNLFRSRLSDQGRIEPDGQRARHRRPDLLAPLDLRPGDGPKPLRGHDQRFNRIEEVPRQVRRVIRHRDERPPGGHDLGRINAHPLRGRDERRRRAGHQGGDALPDRAPIAGHGFGFRGLRRQLLDLRLGPGPPGRQERELAAANRAVALAVCVEMSDRDAQDLDQVARLAGRGSRDGSLANSDRFQLAGHPAYFLGVRRLNVGEAAQHAQLLGGRAALRRFGEDTFGRGEIPGSALERGVGDSGTGVVEDLELGQEARQPGLRLVGHLRARQPGDLQELLGVLDFAEAEDSGQPIVKFGRSLVEGRAELVVGEKRPKRFDRVRPAEAAKIRLALVRHPDRDVAVVERRALCPMAGDARGAFLAFDRERRLDGRPVAMVQVAPAFLPDLRTTRPA